MAGVQVNAKLTTVLTILLLLGCLTFSARCGGEASERDRHGRGRGGLVDGGGADPIGEETVCPEMPGSCEFSACFCCVTDHAEPCYETREECITSCS